MCNLQLCHKRSLNPPYCNSFDIFVCFFLSDIKQLQGHIIRPSLSSTCWKAALIYFYMQHTNDYYYYYYCCYKLLTTTIILSVSVSPLWQSMGRGGRFHLKVQPLETKSYYLHPCPAGAYYLLWPEARGIDDKCTCTAKIIPKSKLQCHQGQI